MQLGALTKAAPGVKDRLPQDKDLRDLVLDMITRDMGSQPRTLQKRIGPSEIGDPCIRKITYKLAGQPVVNTWRDTWLAYIGTSVHEVLARMLHKENQRQMKELGRPRYLIEQRVQITDELSGTMDAFDTLTGTVIDWKTTGSTNLKKYATDGPGVTYETQINAYGLGAHWLGYTVRRVALIFLPRNDTLDKLFVWSSTPNFQLVQNALVRQEAIRGLIQRVDPVTNPSVYTQLPKAPSRLCSYCPWFRPGQDTGVACPGNMG